MFLRFYFDIFFKQHEYLKTCFNPSVTDQRITDLKPLFWLKQIAHSPIMSKILLRSEAQKSTLLHI